MAFIQDFVQNTYSTFTFKVNEKVRFSVDVCYPVITVLINFWTRQEHQENLMPLMFFRKRRWEAEIAFYCEKGSNSRGFVCATIIIDTTHIYCFRLLSCCLHVNSDWIFSLERGVDCWDRVHVLHSPREFTCLAYTFTLTYTWCALM